MKVSVYFDLRNVSFCSRVHAASILLSNNFNAFAIPLRIYPSLNFDEWWEFDDNEDCQKTFVYIRLLAAKILFNNNIVNESLTFPHNGDNHGAIESLEVVKELIDMSVSLINTVNSKSKNCMCQICLRGLNRNILWMP